MPVIPREIYDQVEDHLRRRTVAVQRAAERLRGARERAYSLSGHPADKAGSHGSGKSDPVQRAALALETAEQGLRTALAWADVCSRCDALLRGTPEGALMVLLYIEGLNQAEAAERLGVDRQTVRRQRDTIIAHCALLAAEAGLIRQGGEEHAPEKVDG